MTKPNIILASGSKIRKDILRNAGINFDVIVKPVDESVSYTHLTLPTILLV